MLTSHTPDEAISGGLVKACVPGKIVLFQRKLEFLIYIGNMYSIKMPFWPCNLKETTRACN